MRARFGFFLFFFCRGLLFSGDGLPFPRRSLCGTIFAGVLAGGAFALELQEQFVAQAEALLPGFEFMARLLGCLFVRAEIKNQIGMSHKDCIAGSEGMCQARQRENLLELQMDTDKPSWGETQTAKKNPPPGGGGAKI